MIMKMLAVAYCKVFCNAEPNLEYCQRDLLQKSLGFVVCCRLIHSSITVLGSNENLDELPHDGLEKQSLSQHRANTTMHVCWHRMTSVSAKDHYVSLQVVIFVYLGDFKGL